MGRQRHTQAPITLSGAQEILDLRAEGATLAEIADLFGVTRERIRQIVVRYGGPTATEVRANRQQQQELRTAERAKEVGDSIRETLDAFGPLSAFDVSQVARFTEVDIIKFWPVDVQYMRIREQHGVQRRWSEAQVLDAIRSAAIYEYPFTTKAYAQLVAIGEVDGPSVPRIGQLFGSWTAACDRAGVHAGQAMREDYDSRWSDADILGIIRRYLTDPASPSSAHRYDDWKREHCQDGPSMQTIRNRFGTWTEVKKLALTEGVGSV